MHRWFSPGKPINIIHHINRTNKENHMTISIDGRESIWKNSISTHEFAGGGGNLGIERNFFKKKIIYKKPTANIILYGEGLNTFHLKLWTRQEYLLLPLLFNTVLQILVSAVRKEIKSPMLTEDVIVFCDISNPKEFTREVTKTEFSKIIG